MPRLKPFSAPVAGCRWPAVDPVHPWPILQLSILLMLANGTPVVAKKSLGERFAYPLDRGVEFVDGRPLFGRSKTMRGVLLAVLMTMADIGAAAALFFIGEVLLSRLFYAVRLRDRPY